MVASARVLPPRSSPHRLLCSVGARPPPGLHFAVAPSVDMSTRIARFFLSSNTSQIGVESRADAGTTYAARRLRERGSGMFPDWQPIVTAPKDGTRILIFEPAIGTHVGGSVQVSRPEPSWFHVGVMTLYRRASPNPLVTSPPSAKPKLGWPPANAQKQSLQGCC